MYNYPLSFSFGVAAMVFAAGSYFQKNKQRYLFFQIMNIISLTMSYLFLEEFFAMISYTVSLLRALTFFVYEKKDKASPLAMKFLFVGLAMASYVLVNVVILQKAGWLDVLCLIANILYTFSFGIRNLKLMRYVLLIPNVLSVVYNAMLPATLFVIISFGFELAANILSILRNDVGSKNKKTNISQKENLYEND